MKQDPKIVKALEHVIEMFLRRKGLSRDLNVTWSGEDLDIVYDGLEAATGKKIRRVYALDGESVSISGELEIPEEGYSTLKNNNSCMTRFQIAEALKCDIRKIDSCMRDKKDPLPHMRIGRKFLFDFEKVVEWAERQAKNNPPRPLKGMK